jgi:hypothetical protein
VNPADELARQVKRLEREAEHQVDVTSVRCAQHGPHYACPASRPAPITEWAWRSFDPNGDIQPDLGRVQVPTGAYYVQCRHIACKHIANGRCPECPQES